MTKNVSAGDKNKDYDTDNLEKILARFVDSNEICVQCGQSHRFKPTFEKVKTSIDFIPLLLQTLQRLEQVPQQQMQQQMQQMEKETQLAPHEKYDIATADSLGCNLEY